MGKRPKIALKDRKECSKGLLSDIHLEPIDKPFSLEDVVIASLEAFCSDKELI